MSQTGQLRMQGVGLAGNLACKSGAKFDNRSKNSVSHVGFDDSDGSDKAVFACDGSSLSEVESNIQSAAIDFLVGSGSDSKNENVNTWEYVIKAKS